MQVEERGHQPGMTPQPYFQGKACSWVLQESGQSSPHPCLASPTLAQEMSSATKVILSSWVEGKVWQLV